jgi:hypothetical protein
MRTDGRTLKEVVMKKINVAALSLCFLASIAAPGCVAGAEDTASADEARTGSAEEAISAGTYLVRNANSQEMLNVFGASTKDGAPMIQWPAAPTGNEQFTIASTSDGYSTITAFNGKCLGIFGGNSSVGTGITQWACDGSDHQKFTITSVGTGAYQIKPKPSSLCLTVYADSTADGYAVVQAPCVADKASQVWSFELP